MGYAAVYIPEFPAVAFMRLHTNLRSQALAILEGKAPLQRVVSLNSRAQAMHLAHGMSKVQVEAVESVLFYQRSLRQEENTFREACKIMERFSPRIQVIAGPSNNYSSSQTLSVSVVLDQTGTEKLFGTPKQYGLALHGALSNADFHTNVSVTANAHASLMLARSQLGVTSVSKTNIATSLKGLPVSLLPCETATLRVLARWGVRTLGELAALPDTALVSRIGQHARHLQRLALGIEDYFMVPETEAFTLHEHIEPDSPIEALDSLLFVISPMLNRLMCQAISRAYALRAITLTLKLDKAAPYTLHVRPALSTQSCQLLLKLLNLDLQARSPEAAILDVSLSAEATKSQTAQRGLFQPQFPDTDKLDLLLARLRSIAGEHNVGSPELRNTQCDDEFGIATYQPTALMQRQENAEPNTRLALRRFRPPQSARVTLLNGRPSKLFWNNQRFEVADAKGPWQSSGYWWDQRAWVAEEWDAILKIPWQRLRLRNEGAHDFWMVAGIYD